MALRPTNFRLETEIIAALQRLKIRDGVPVSEQVRRALIEWIEKKGETIKTERGTRGKRGRRS